MKSFRSDPSPFKKILRFELSPSPSGPHMWQGFIVDEDDEEGSKATWWDAMAAFYDDPFFVYGTPLEDLNPGPLARGPHPLGRKPSPASAPAPTPNPVSPVSVVSESAPNTILWASGTLKLLGIWTCDLEDEFEGLLCVRVKSERHGSRTQ